MSRRDDEDLLRLLAGGAVEDAEEEESHVPLSVPITRGTLAKAHAICDIVREIAGKPHEWYSYLLASRGDPTYAVRDLLVVNGTKAWPYHVQVDGDAVARAVTEVQTRNTENGTDYYIIGWLHSHAAGMPGHSTTDDENFKQLVSTVRFNTERALRVPLNLIESTPHVEHEAGVVVIRGENIEDGMTRYGLPPLDALNELLAQHHIEVPEGLDQGALLHDLLSTMDIRITEPNIVGFGYSVVVNDARAEPHAEIGITEQRVITGGKLTYQAEKTIIDVVDVDDDVTFERDALKEMVQARLVFPPEPKYVQPRRVHPGRGRQVAYIHDPTTNTYRPIYVQYAGGTTFASPAPSHQVHQPSQGVQVPTHPHQEWGDWGGYDEDVFGELPPLHGVASTPSAPTVRTLLTKVAASSSLDDDTLVDFFLTTVARYQSLFRRPEVQYADHLDRVLEEIGRHKVGLTAAVKRVGPLIPDGAQIHDVSFPFSRFQAIGNAIYDNLPTDLEHPERQFLWEFAALGNANAIIEKHLPLIMAYGLSLQPPPLGGAR